jgi:hypothetical protein
MTQFQSSGLSGLNGMIQDITNYLKFALLTSMGITMTLLCLSIALLVLLITRSLSPLGIIIAVIVFVLFCVLSYLVWFSGNRSTGD